MVFRPTHAGRVQFKGSPIKGEALISTNAAFYLGLGWAELSWVCWVELGLRGLWGRASWVGFGWVGFCWIGWV